MGNTIEIRDGDFHLRIHLDKIEGLPAANFRRVMRLLQKHPEALAQAGDFLREQVAICKAGLDGTRREYDAGWREINPRSRSTAALKILAENKRLSQNLQQAKTHYATFSRLLQIYENQGGNHA